jgi:filamentous hemagglutinin family protein
LEVVGVMTVSGHGSVSAGALARGSADPLVPARPCGPLRASRLPFATATAIAAVLALPRPGLAGPTGGSVVAGSAAISQSGATTNVNQSSNRAVINWQGFSIAPSETVNFNQPSSASATLNRVVGNERSIISGALNANGQVFIVNSAGVLFTKGAQVNVGGLVASTLDISNQDFMAGNHSFSGSSSASVINQGHIRAAPGGYVALLGKTVSNDGVIVAKLGTVAMASGDKITLNFAGNSLADVTIDQGTLNALVQNKRAIIADGGHVIMTAKAADQVLSAQVNNSGVIQARTMASLKGGAGTRVVHTGSIKLLAQGGTVNVSGKLDASAAKGGDGGFIETSGDKVKVSDSAVITTKAAAGQNGSWLIDPDGFTIAPIGGDITGNLLSHELAATNVTIASTSGHGADGNVNVNDTVNWSAGTTLTLNATDAVNVNAAITAPNGGLLLNAGTDVNVNAPSSLQVATLNATALGNVNLNAAQTWTNAGNWTFNGTNINVNDTVNWSAGKLTLNAGFSDGVGGNPGPGFINLNAVMTASGTASLVATYDTDMDRSTVLVQGKMTASPTYGTPLGGINPLFDPSTGTFVGRIDFVNNTAARPLTINKQPYTLITSMQQLDMLDQFDSVSGTGTPTTTATGNYALATNLDACGIGSSCATPVIYTSAPIGTFSGGTFEGLGHTIDNLTIAPPVGNGGNNALIGQVGTTPGASAGTIRDIGIRNIQIYDAGDPTIPGDLLTRFGDAALVATNNGAIINAFAAGAGGPGLPDPLHPGQWLIAPNPIVVPTGGDPNLGPTLQYLREGAPGVAIAGGDTIGGLVASNSGIIVNSHADVSVYGVNNVGGLVGSSRSFSAANPAIMLNDYATGAVFAGQPGAGSTSVGSNGIGGFIGSNNGGVISNSFSTGAVTTLNSGDVGGFAGQNASTSTTVVGVLNRDSSYGTVTYNYTVDIVVFGSEGVGGLVGGNTGQVSFGFTSSNVNVTTWSTSGVAVAQPIAEGSLIGFEQFSGLTVLHRFGENDSSTATGALSCNKCFQAFVATDSAGRTTNPNPVPTPTHPGPNPDPGPGDGAANARSQAQVLTQQAIAQQFAFGQAQVGTSAGTAATTANLNVLPANPPSGGLSDAGTSAATSPTSAALNANFKAIETNVHADDEGILRHRLAATGAAPHHPGLGATIRSLEINGRPINPNENKPPNGAPGQKP